MAGELPGDWESDKLGGGADAEDPSAAGGDSLAELPDPMADGMKDQSGLIQDPTGTHKSGRSGVASTAVNGRMIFSQEMVETDDYGNILPSLPNAPQGKLDSLPSFEPNGSSHAEVMPMDEDSNSAEFGFADSNGPTGNSGCSPPPPEPSDFGSGVTAQVDRKLNESVNETLPTVTVSDGVPETPTVSVSAKLPEVATSSTKDSSAAAMVVNDPNQEYFNYQHGEDGYLYFQDKEGNYYYQGEDGFAYRWTTGGTTTEQAKPKDAIKSTPPASVDTSSANDTNTSAASELDNAKLPDTAAAGNVAEKSTTGEAAAVPNTNAIGAPASWPGFPTGWPPQDFSSAYYGGQYPPAPNPGYPPMGFPPPYMPYPPPYPPYGYYDYGSSSGSTSTKGPINLTETKFEFSEEKKNATKSIVSRQLKVMASMKGKLSIKKPTGTGSSASLVEDGRSSTASGESATLKLTENGNAAAVEKAVVSPAILLPTEKRTSKFSDPVPMGTYGPAIPKTIEPVVAEIPQKSIPLPAEVKPAVQRRDSGRSGGNSRSPQSRSNRYRSRDEYSPDRRSRKDDRRGGYGGADRYDRDKNHRGRERYTPDRNRKKSRETPDEKRATRYTDGETDSSDSDRPAKMRFDEKVAKLFDPVRDVYSPTKPSEPEAEVKLLVKSADDESKQIEWPKAIVRKTTTEPKLAFSCRPDSFTSFDVLFKTQDALTAAILRENQSCEDMELEEEASEVEEKTKVVEPHGPKLPPAAPTVVPVPSPSVAKELAKEKKLLVGYPTISYPSIQSEKSPVQPVRVEEKPMELKKFGPVEPPPSMVAKPLVKAAEFKPVPPAIPKPAAKEESLSVGDFSGRSKAQVDAELERLRLEALASMENAKNVLAQVAKLSGKSHEEISSEFAKVQPMGKSSSSEESEEELVERKRSKSKGKAKRDKKKSKPNRKEKVLTKGKRKKPVEEDSEGEEELLDESSSESSSESESEEESRPKRRGKKGKKPKKKVERKHKVKKGKRRKQPASDEDENSSDEESSESDVKSSKKKRKRVKDKRRRKHEESSESEESSEDIPVKPMKKKRRQDGTDSTIAVSKEIPPDDEVPSVDEDETESKRKSKSKKSKGKGKKERSVTPDVKKKKRNKREPSSSSSEEEEPVAKAKKSRHSESTTGASDSGKRGSDTQSQHQGSTGQQQQQRGENKAAANELMAQKSMNIFDTETSKSSGLMSEYEMFENELFKSNSASTDTTKTSLYDNIDEPIKGDGLTNSNSSAKQLEIPPTAEADRDSAKISLHEQRQLLARLESQSVDPNTRGVINQLKAALKAAETQLAESNGSKSQSESSSVDASPSPGNIPSKKSQPNHKGDSSYGRTVQIKRKEESKRHGKGRQESSSPSPPPPPPPRRPVVEDPRLHKPTAPANTEKVTQPYFVTVATYMAPTVAAAAAATSSLYKPVTPASQPAKTTRQSRFSTSYKRN